MDCPVAAALPVLTFHAIDNRNSLISFSPALFERCMRLLYAKGYRTLNLVDVANSLRKGLSFPAHSLVITFDDGYQSVYEHAFPVLQRYHMTATVFLTVGETRAERLPSMEGRSMLGWQEIKEMHRAGIVFGAHTMTHPDLTRLPEKLVTSEILSGKAAIEDTLGAPVVTFAYPFGRYDNRCRELVGCHFVCACSDRLGLLQSSSDRFAMERVDAYYFRSETLFRTIGTSVLPWYIQARNIPRGIRRALLSV
jgi:peptidoglycan/xylan/chitin deacetylase (PgdA/CDA1 family)